MLQVDLYIILFFIATVIFTLLLFYRAANRSKITMILILPWIFLQSYLGLSSFYSNTETIPPRFILMISPPLLLIIFLFWKKKAFINSLNQNILTLIHLVRIPVEIILYLLFLNKFIPELMTFEGRNFDILAGLTAPFIYYFAYIKKKVSPKLILIWNGISLCLLLNIVIISILSAPSPFQQMAFEQANIAIQYFPMNLLASVIVPIVLFSHLVSIRNFFVKN